MVPLGPPPPDVVALLRRVTQWEGQNPRLVAHDEGPTNRSCLVTVSTEAGDAGSSNAQQFLVRSPGLNSDLLGIERGIEHEAASRAATLGLGPEVTAFLASDAALVIRVVPDAVALTPPDIHQPEVLNDAVDLLRTFHESPPITGGYDWFDVPCRYVAAAEERGIARSDAVVRARHRAEEVRAAFAARPDAPVAAHNDLRAANFVRDAAGRLWLTDWEDAGMNDRYFDLGDLARTNDLDADGDEAVIEAYFGDVTMGRLARLRLMKAMSDFRAATWGLAQVGTGAAGVDFEAHASTHFDRLLATASSPRWSRLLVEAAAGSGLRG